MRRSLTSTSHGRKLLFDSILSAELAVCKYRIDAFYEWKNRAQIFSLKFTDANTAALGINLNTAMEDVFSDRDSAMELTIRYRCYFIITYLRCLESAADTVPSTLFQGLVALEAIGSLQCGSTLTAHSPLGIRVASGVKPIDVCCAIRALTRICIDQGDLLSQQVQANCEHAISWMVSYTRLPEVEYDQPGKPEYTALRDLLRIQSLAASAPTLLAQYSLFRAYGILSFDDLTIGALLADEALSEFWVGVLIRVLAFSADGNHAMDVAAFPLMRKGIAKFKEDSAAYFQECNAAKQELLRSNLLAVKQTAMRIEQTFGDHGSVETGALHYIQ